MDPYFGFTRVVLFIGGVVQSLASKHPLLLFNDLLAVGPGKLQEEFDLIYFSLIAAILAPSV